MGIVKTNKLYPKFSTETQDAMLRIGDREINLNYCLSCTTCENNCPYNIMHAGVNPRIFMHKLVLGMKEDIFNDPFIWECIACGRCTATCPMKLDVAETVRTLRGEINKVKGFSVFHKLAYRGVLSHQKLLRVFGVLGRFYDRSGIRWVIRRSGILNVSKKLKNNENILPLRLKPPLKNELSKLLAQVDQPRFKIGYFVGCATNTFFSEIGIAAILYLQHLGCQVEVPIIKCCGGPHKSAGDVHEAKTLAKEIIEAYSKEDYDFIVSDCATCGSALKEYKALFRNDSEMKEKARQFSEKYLDLNKFILDYLSFENDKALNDLNTSVTYHDPCHLARGLGITKEPRELLKKIPGLIYIEMKDADWCCGGAGTYCMTQQRLSEKMLDAKINNFIKTKANILITSCPACTLQLSAGLRKKGIKAEVKHPVQLLAESAGIAQK